MHEIWFDAAMYAWIPGTLLGLFGGLLGVVTGVFAGRGKHATMVFRLWYAFIAIGVLLLLTGGYALLAGQPYGVWYTFLLPGLLVTVLGLSILPRVKKSYTQAELRKMSARDA
jgi:hypothetical protein